MKEIIQSLAAQRSRLQKISVVAFAGLAAAVALLMFGQRLPALALGAAVLAFYFIWLRRRILGYSDEIARASVLNGLAAPLRDPVFLDRQGMTVEELDALAMLPVRRDGNALMLRQGFEGRRDGGVCRGWEITFHYPRSSGKRADFGFFSGTLLTKSFDRPVAEEGDWLALREDLLDAPTLEAFLSEKGYRAASPKDGGLRFYGKGSESVPPAVAARVKGLAEKTSCFGAARLMPNGAAVYLDRHFYTQRVKVRDLPTEAQLLANPLAERDDIWDLFLFWQRSRPKEEE